MTPPRHDAAICLSDRDLEAMLERAAEEARAARSPTSGSAAGMMPC